jgi:hypothetical protein
MGLDAGGLRMDAIFPPDPLRYTPTSRRAGPELDVLS